MEISLHRYVKRVYKLIGTEYYNLSCIYQVYECMVVYIHDKLSYNILFLLTYIPVYVNLSPLQGTIAISECVQFCNS